MMPPSSSVLRRADSVFGLIPAREISRSWNLRGPWRAASRLGPRPAQDTSPCEYNIYSLYKNASLFAGFERPLAPAAEWTPDDQSPDGSRRDGPAAAARRSFRRAGIAGPRRNLARADCRRIPTAG